LKCILFAGFTNTYLFLIKLTKGGKSMDPNDQNPTGPTDNQGTPDASPTQEPPGGSGQTPPVQMPPTPDASGAEEELPPPPPASQEPEPEAPGGSTEEPTGSQQTA